MIPPFFPAPSPAAGLLPVPSGTVRADNGCLPPHPLRCGAPKRLHRAPATALSAYRPLSKDCAFGYSSFSLLFIIVLGCTALYRRFFLWILVVPLHIGGFSYCSWSYRFIPAVFLIVLGYTASYRRFFLLVLIVPLHTGGFSYRSWLYRFIPAVFLMVLGCTASYRRFFLWILIVPLHIGGFSYCS